MADMMAAKTLLQPVIDRAQQNPQHRSLVFIGDDGTQQVVRAAQFCQDMVRYARVLHATGIKPEDLVILVLRHSPELLSAFWGAMYLGATPSIFPFLTEKLDPMIYMERVRAQPLIVFRA